MNLQRGLICFLKSSLKIVSFVKDDKELPMLHHTVEIFVFFPTILHKQFVNGLLQDTFLINAMFAGMGIYHKNVVVVFVEFYLSRIKLKA